MARKVADLIDQQVGQAIRLRRTAFGMSQEMLAVQVGLTYQQIQKYEKGTNRVSANRLSQIASILKVKAAYFFEHVPSKPSSTELRTSARLAADCLTTLSSAVGLALMKSFRLIKDARLRRHIVDMVERIAHVFSG
jgi:transcriptional regulator with XRE-family HTH domain